MFHDVVASATRSRRCASGFSQRVKRPPRRQHSTTTTANTERISDTHHAIPPYHSTPCRLLCRRARDIIIALIGRIGAASTATLIPIPIPIAPSPSKKRVPSNLATDGRHYEQYEDQRPSGCKTLASQTKLHHHNLRRSSVSPASGSPPGAKPTAALRRTR